MLLSNWVIGLSTNVAVRSDRKFGRRLFVLCVPSMVCAWRRECFVFCVCRRKCNLRNGSVYVFYFILKEVHFDYISERQLITINLNHIPINNDYLFRIAWHWNLSISIVFSFWNAHGFSRDASIPSHVILNSFVENQMHQHVKFTTALK